MASAPTSSRAAPIDAAPATDNNEKEVSQDHTTNQQGNESSDEDTADDQASQRSAHSEEPGEIQSEDNVGAPPLPNEPPPEAQDDGWDYHWDETSQAYFFHNRITGASTWENPRTSQAAPGTSTATSSVAEPPKNERPPAGGYNPAIHGDYDPNAWYARSSEADAAAGQAQAVDPAAAYAAIGSFNRFTGRWQGEGQDSEQHNDENKSRRQMNAYFDVDAAANSHDGRSLKAERSGKKPNKAELKQFKEKRRAKKEEKRRAWLRD